MPYINTGLVNAWTDRDRFNLIAIDDNLEYQIASQVIERASQVFDTSTWADTATTPKIIISIIAMQYAGRSYQSKTLDNISEMDNYGSKLIDDSNLLLDKIIMGEIGLRDEDGNPIPMISSGVISGEPTEGEPSFSMELEF